MLPIFNGDERRQRHINLGGTPSGVSIQDVIRQAKADRNERERARQKEEAARKLQAIWRGTLTAKRTKVRLRAEFDSDPSTINAMRCLVVIANDEDRLTKWTEYSLTQDEASLFALANGPARESWLVLIRQIAVLLLRSIANNPQSPSSVSFLRALIMLTSPSSINKVLPSSGVSLSQNFLDYLLRHDFYRYLQRSIETIPPEAKSLPSVPYIASLITVPSFVFSHESTAFLNYLTDVFRYILSISLLPNRFPLSSLSQLSARLPLDSIHLLDPEMVSSIPVERKIHVIANLVVFMPPRFKKLSAKSLDVYLKFVASLFDDLLLIAPSANESSSWNVEDEEEEAPDRQVEHKRSVLMTNVDKKTWTRILSFTSRSHLSALFSASSHHPSTRLSMYKFLLSLYSSWPTHKGAVLDVVVSTSGGGVIRELYRVYVRPSPLGKTSEPGSLTGKNTAAHWPPLLFMTDVYTQTLLTMSDDEFFSSDSLVTSASAIHKNPLTIDEVVSFSKQLMNIAFMLYWFENSFQGVEQSSFLTWESIRDKITKLLTAIHARDSRRPFTPPNHWHTTSQLDMNSFVEAARYEEEQLIQPNRQSRPLTQRQLSSLSPRLGILNNIPFAIPFENRVGIFRHFVMSDMNNATGHFGRSSVIIRRDHVSSDGFDKLWNVDLKGRVQITFVDQFGEEEAGIDGGGVFKEFFTSLCKEVFNADRGLWLSTRNNELYPNPSSIAKEPHSLDWYRFIGRILGKALYDGILIDVAFAGFFLAKWLGKQSYLDDLASLDPQLYNGLLFLKNFDGDPEDLELYFSVLEDDFGITKSVDLIPNGSSIPVTKENRLQYINLVSYHRLTRQIRPQSEAFFQGLSELIEARWLRMFNQQELQILIGGVNSPIDLNDLRANTNYGGVYGEDHDTIRLFWKVVNDFDHEQRRALLRFATSCSRPPLLGFKELSPLFAIRDAGSDESRLPTASTCVNLLKLPVYKSEAVMRSKLLQAINSGAGFDLS